MLDTVYNLDGTNNSFPLKVILFIVSVLHAGHSLQPSWNKQFFSIEGNIIYWKSTARWTQFTTQLEQTILFY